MGDQVCPGKRDQSETSTTRAERTLADASPAPLHDYTRRPRDSHGPAPRGVHSDSAWGWNLDERRADPLPAGLQRVSPIADHLGADGPSDVALAIDRRLFVNGRSVAI